MGRAVMEAAAGNPAVRITAALVRPGSPLAGQKTGNVSFTTDLETALAGCDVVLDFSVPETTAAALEACQTARKPFVTGVTGLGRELEQRLAEAGRSIPVLAAPNMSFGVALLMRLVRSAAGVLGEDFDVEIIETHHRHKKDAPSGTALALGQAVAAARNATSHAPGASGAPRRGPRQPGEIGYVSIRAGDIAGEHTVLFAATGERLELTHRAASRVTFAQGALRAAAWISRQSPGVYGMADVLGDGRRG